MFKMPDGPCVYVDVDDTLIRWSVPTGDEQKDELVTVVTRDIKQTFVINKYNLDYLEKLAVRGHLVIVWSAAGAVWAEAVVKALGLDNMVTAVMSKPNYYVDDIGDANQFMGKHVFFDENGVRTGYVPKRN